jgi:hypothetical protein
MIFIQSKNVPIIGINGHIEFTPHLWTSNKFCPKCRLKIQLQKHRYYFLGFGSRIKEKFISFHIKSSYDKNVYYWWKRKTYVVSIRIIWDKLFNHFCGETK